MVLAADEVVLASWWDLAMTAGVAVMAWDRHEGVRSGRSSSRGERHFEVDSDWKTWGVQRSHSA